MTDTWKSFALPEVLRPAEDDSLQAFLRDNATSAVRIDASRLRRLDTPLIELLLIGAKEWRAKALPFELVGLSRVSEEVCMQLGLRSDHLIWRVAA